MTPWKLPLIVVALVVPIVAGFAIGGAGTGLAVGALTVLALVLVAARQRPRGPIASAPSSDSRRHLLLVATCPVEEPEAVARITAAAALGEGDAADVLVLAPARIRFLDRWASDVEPARRAAQRNLVATVAALAKAGVEAEARVGDEDVVQAVEDQLQTFPATEVVLIGDGAGEEDLADAAAELGERLEADFRRVAIDG
jgi:hypothetical protein